MFSRCLAAGLLLCGGSLGLAQEIPEDTVLDNTPLEKSSAARAERKIVLSELPLLFADDSGVIRSEGATRTFHPATRREKPVMEAEGPAEGTRLYVYGSVIIDPVTGEFRMWYMSRAKIGGSDYILYATSPDGEKWSRPVLNLHEVAGSKANNVISGGVGPSVIYDTFEKDPAKRYKMLEGKRDYDLLSSPDGINWKPMTEKSVIRGGDTHTVTQDPLTGEFLLYRKSDRAVRGRIRRSVVVSRSFDFINWTGNKLALATDDLDDSWAKEEDHNTQVYSMSVFPHAGGFIGLPSLFYVTSIGNRTTGRSGQDGPLDVQLVTSPDGENWQRTNPRLAIIPRGQPGSYDGGGILGVANSLIHRGDKTFTYYTAMNLGHGSASIDKKFTIGRADWRLHGIASLDAGDKAARIETRALRIAGGALVVNADAAKGELRAALTEADGKPIAGFDLADCEPISADAVRSTIRWKGKTAVPTDREVRVVVEMKNARLFSLSSDAAKP